MAIDKAKDYLRLVLASGIDNVTTTINLVDGADAPDPAIFGEYSLVIYKADDKSAMDYPSREQVRVIAKPSTHVLTVTRGYGGTVANYHNEAGKKYYLEQAFTASHLEQIRTDMTGHNQAISTITGLQGALDGKSSTSHNHTLNGLSEKSYNSLTDKPTIPTALSALSTDTNNQRFSETEKTKLSGIATNANNYVHPAGTNPHGTTKADLDLGNVPNLSFSGSNTGDETQTTLRSKLGISTLIAQHGNDHLGSGNGARIVNPSGGSFVTSTPAVTGAIRIKLPDGYPNLMFMFDVKVYNYAGGDGGGNSREFRAVGHLSGSHWYNWAVTELSLHTSPIQVRAGVQDGAYCLWIGELDSVWYYPQVFITNVQAGYSGYTEAYLTGTWNVSFVTSFGTVNNGPVPAIRFFNTYNDGTGSGLDADLLDGLQATDFAPTSHNQAISTIIGLQGALDGKASTSVATTSVNGLMASTDKIKLDGIASNANNYSHPTGAGNNHIPTGGSVGQVIKNTASGTGTWQNEYSYTHPGSGTNPHGTTKADVGLSNVPNLAFSGSNTGDETTTTLGTKINSATTKTTPVDADKFSIWNSVGGLLESVTWSNIKATLKTYFDNIYCQGNDSRLSDARTPTTHNHIVVIPHTFTISGEIKVPSGDTDFICPFYVNIPSGKTVKLLGLRRSINSGTSATIKLQRNGADATGFTSLSTTTTATSTTPTAITLTNNDRINLIVTAVSGTPKNLSVTLFLEYTL